MQYTYEMLRGMQQEYGEAFYVLDTARFAANYRELLAAFRAEYPNTEVAYSYKTNYIPALCEAINDLGGYAEVVSHMEFALAKRVGVPFSKIVFNGPYKQPDAVKELLLGGGTVHVDSLEELPFIAALAKGNPDKRLNIGIRVNFPVGDGALSRFGFDVLGDDFLEMLQFAGKFPNVHLQTLHCHFASRALNTWKPRAAEMMKLIKSYGLRPERIDLGGGMFGKMDDRLKRQFSGELPEYQDYAQAVGKVFREWLKGDYQPALMIEPGSALAGDCMDLVSKVKSVKTVQGHKIATVLASTHNLHMGSKVPSMDVFGLVPDRPWDGAIVHVAGYTCIESDYLLRDYQGSLAVGDYVVFRNIGSYSIVLKPPFILPDFPVLSVGENGAVQTVKRAETPEDVFQTYRLAKEDTHE